MRPIDADALVSYLNELELTYIQMADEVPDKFKEYYRGRFDSCAEVVAHVIRHAPTLDCVQAEPGEWLVVTKPNRWGGAKLRCSNCNGGSMRRWKHCPNCGAKMDGGEKDD